MIKIRKLVLKIFAVLIIAFELWKWLNFYSDRFNLKEYMEKRGLDWLI